MKRKVIPAIVAAERLKHGIVVRFDDGRCVFYSATILYRNIPQAELQDEKAIDW